MKYVVSVSKTFIHRGNHKHRSSTKKKWFVYYYDVDGNFKSEKVNWFFAMYYKTQKRKRIKYVCTECERIFLGFVKSSRDELECPYCEV